MLIALAFAFVAMFTYGTGTVLQAVGARQATTSEHLDVLLFARLARQPKYIIGLVLDAIGFLAALLALRTLPLFVVQAAIAGSVGVTAAYAAKVLHLRLRRADKIALGLLVAGLGLLCISARDEGTAHLTSTGAWILLGGVAVVATGAAISAKRPDPQGALGLATFAGLGFAGVAVAEHTLHFPTPWWHVAWSPIAIALVAYGACGMLFFASALQRGAVTATTAVLFAAQTLVPTVVGFVFLGDRTRAHFEIVALVGFVLTVGASLSLARYSEVDASPQESPEPAA